MVFHLRGENPLREAVSEFWAFSYRSSAIGTCNRGNVHESLRIHVHDRITLGASWTAYVAIALCIEDVVCVMKPWIWERIDSCRIDSTCINRRPIHSPISFLRLGIANAGLRDWKGCLYVMQSSLYVYNNIFHYNT